ncbi:hypothetical protein M422DRAFT_177043 [Sphaerobolus stellatus SS14]|uniref:HAT C-terminal dimerisation domain-containing protein n=1 Tax=Sphaerobolus stellatus (strain SS14) TaxID=990650 RepID=A0A0C9VKS1_SPHS4|nr:hypothetical protein M422DRAFT_177043 [Sphaerobolus stellatus SS14]
MLILDIKTRCTSTHQMCRHALFYPKEIDDYVVKNRELQQYELSNDEWDVVSVVTAWLLIFRKATMSMSTTKCPMLLSTHAILKGLQDKLQEELSKLPKTTAPSLCKALVDAHTKLGEYFFKIDQSPYILWASHDQLCWKNSGDAASTADDFGFTSCYVRRPLGTRNELQEYFQLLPEEFNSTNPIEWWGARKAQFPNLNRLARNILSIPGKCSIHFCFFAGSAVAVECIFSGGRDTISLRRASLKPETIRILMIVKQKIRLDRTREQ